MDDDVRHIGDLGNVYVHSDGTAKVNIRIEASKFPLVGTKSIIGRTLVLHNDPDDLGLGNASDSKMTGHAGGRLGCGVIGIDSNFSPADADGYGTGSAQLPRVSLLLNLVMIAVVSGITWLSSHY